MAATTMIWPGISGEEYPFESYPLSQKFNHVKGNYIFARLGQGNVWHAVYIGEGWLDERTTPSNEHWTCIQQNDATTVFVRVEADDSSRLRIEADLLARHDEAYAPVGCNQKPGG